MIRLTLIVLGLISTVASAAEPQKLGTPEQRKRASEWNRNFRSTYALPAWDVKKPFSEMETTGYVAISGEDNYELPDLREAIAKNLPHDVSLVIYISDRSMMASLKNEYGKYLGDRLKFLLVPPGTNEIWGRDSLPFPVYMNNEYGLVDSLYPQDFEPDQEFSKAMSVRMLATKQYFRGGNLLFDFDSNCFTENANETADLNDPEGYFKKFFGCKTVTILEQRGGIGDVDERIKFLNGKDVLTDDDLYAGILKSKGYNVRRVPKVTSGAYYETYMNTLYVNGTIFVPQMGEPSDQVALEAYRREGFNPVGVHTKRMADRGHGNIHCVTMNYPQGSFVPSLLSADFIEFAH